MSQSLVSEFISPKGGVIDKIKRYGWSIKDEPGMLMMVPKHELKVDHFYQRDFQEHRANKMAANWSWLACGALIVADRDGDFFVVAGQHRLGAAMKRSDITELPCIVFDSKGRSQEAAVFVTESLDRKGIDWVDRLRAKAASGDQVALCVQKLIQDVGRAAGRTPSGKTVSCIAALYNEYSSNQDLADGVFRLVSHICRGQGIDNRLFLALCYIEKRLPVGISLYQTPQLRAKLMKMGPAALMDEINRASAFYQNGGKRIWAKAVVGAINKGLRNKISIAEEEE